MFGWGPQLSPRKEGEKDENEPMKVERGEAKETSDQKKSSHVESGSCPAPPTQPKESKKSGEKSEGPAPKRSTENAQ